MIQRISVLLTFCLLQFATAVLAQSASDTPTADGLLDSRRTVWYDRDANENQPTVSNWKYLENRRALVGSGCTVNKLVSAVGVGEWADSLGNITNEDLSDYATFPSVLKAGVTVNPIVSVCAIRTTIMARALKLVFVWWPHRGPVCLPLMW